MAFANFIPQVWNAQMLLDFREAATAAAVANRGYEGDASVGNHVKITTAVDVTVKDYKANSRQTTPDAIDNTQVSLLIDQEKSFDFLVDDVDRRQAAGGLDVYTQSAGLAMAEDADKFLLNALHNGAAVAHQLSETTAPATASEAWDILRDLRVSLNKASVPRSQRVAFVNAEFASLLLGAESKLTAVDTSGSSAGLREATLGRILGFDIIETENLPVTAEPQVVAAYTPTFAFVSQVTETEALRDVDSFSDRLRGLHVYGAKVLRAGVGVATWNVDVTP